MKTSLSQAWSKKVFRPYLMDRFQVHSKTATLAEQLSYARGKNSIF